MSETFSTKDVASHNTVENGLYIIIDGSVYSLASFVDEHPGGAKILKRVGGKDASKQFWKVCGCLRLRFPFQASLTYIVHLLFHCPYCLPSLPAVCSCSSPPACALSLPFRP